MAHNRSTSEPLSEFLQYLANRTPENNRLPSLNEISQELGISVASLREQLEAARTLGVVEVKTKTGIKKVPYSIKPALRHSLSYGLQTTPSYFSAFSDLRKHLETAYWYDAVSKLTPEDQVRLRYLVRRAKEKLRGDPIQIPHGEHRELHVLIYKRLDNPIVIEILEIFWELYEAVGLDVFTDLPYLQQVWRYHEKMVESIIEGNFEIGYKTLVDHMDLLQQRSHNQPRQHFE